MTHAPSTTASGTVVVGQSSRMKAVFDFLGVIADSDSTVLITGESGTGKEVVARTIHERSGRSHQPFVVVSCALFSETLIEAELFGHERGAFTGAIRDRAGRFELAHGGTIFLDDIDDIPLGLQVKLLRVLQNRTVERLGGTRTLQVDVRVLAATKRDLRTLVADGKFREDLYYRLNVLPIVLPPLRERREDIPELMEHFLAHYYRKRGEDAPPVSAAVRQAFVRYAWPGNVRELENACERIAQTCSGGEIDMGCAPLRLVFNGDPLPPLDVRAAVALEPPPILAPPTIVGPISLEDRLRDVERALIDWALQMSAGNKSKAADLLRVKRSTLGDRIVRCGLQTARHEHAMAAAC